MVKDFKKKKVLLLYNYLFHYRIPIFKLLADKCDLTVAFCMGSNINEDVNFKIIKLPYIKYKRFVIHSRNIFKLCQDFDVVIIYADIAWLNYSILPFHRNKKFKTIFWSIGVSASYDKAYDSITKWDKVRDFIFKKADALVFYSDYPIKKYIDRGYCKEKLFVAPNTVEVYNNKPTTQHRDSILFIGSLYMQKGLLLLLESYRAAFLIDPHVINLNIIGGGEELDKIKDWINRNNLSEKIILHGAIFDSIRKAEIFQRSIACISPNQAGLSVLESMGYAVPFVTHKDAITGGERLNIINNENGLLLNNMDQLTNVILDISVNPKAFIQMGINAQNHYLRCRKPMDMANGLWKAIQYVLG